MKVNIERNGDSDAITCRYLVGADGVKSTVRKQLGYEMIGESGLQDFVNIYFKSPDIGALMQKHNELGMLYFCYSDELISVLVCHDIAAGEFVLQHHIALWRDIGRRLGLRRTPATHFLISARMTDTKYPGISSGATRSRTGAPLHKLPGRRRERLLYTGSPAGQDACPCTASPARHGSRLTLAAVDIMCDSWGLMSYRAGPPGLDSANANSVTMTKYGLI